MNNTQQQPSRPTIGLVIGYPEEVYYTQLWLGVTDVARERDVNLICFAGGALRSLPYLKEFQYQRNMIYDLVNAKNVDGIIILSGSLGDLVGSELVGEFCRRYHTMPMVSISLGLEGVPSVLVDNEAGMRAAVTHLIEVHDYRRIAFIHGPEEHPEASERYRAYTTALAQHGLPLETRLTAPGNFSEASGTEAIALWLDERGLRPQVDFEVVVAADDVTAIGAMEALKARGISVPDDVAVIGFDDVEDARFAVPPLTTVRQPVYEMGRQATDMLLTLLAGEQVPGHITLPTELITRESCGCLNPAVVRAAARSMLPSSPKLKVKTRAQLASALSAQEKNIVSAAGKSASHTVRENVKQLLDAFIIELNGNSPGAFLAALNKILRQLTSEDSELDTWQEAISILRQYTLPYLYDHETLSWVDDLWQQVRVTIGVKIEQLQKYQALKAAKWAEMQRMIGEDMITAFDVKKLIGVLADSLPKLDIPGCYISVFEQKPEFVAGEQRIPKISRLLYAYDEKRRIELEVEGRGFLTHNLTPEQILPQDRQYSILAESLYFEKNQLGFVLFEMRPRKASIYETLRSQLSSALQGALLLQEQRLVEENLQKAYTEVEKKVEERTAELQQEMAKHERLQQEIIEVQQRALQELATPIIPVMEDIIIMPLIGAIDSKRAIDITRALLAGIREHQAKVAILDITAVPLVDSGVANHLHKTIQAARLKGAQTIVTGISYAVAETIVDLGIDWSGIETLSDLQTGLRAALARLGRRIT